MEINKEIVEYVAALSRLELSEQEEARVEKDMGRIIAYMDMLNQLDTEGIEPMSHAFPVRNVFREDELQPSADRETLLANAPKREAGSFLVPRTVE